ncbi:MAG TPA: coproporphyrinogen III oxidase family protein [Campylobacterales bacterium]|nr:coproporphyrinogen III oxidase family protein [Campylobacterales bacterium]
MLLYLHIPFCDSKCHYCAFNSYVDKFDLKVVYMNAILIQLKSELERFEATDQNIETLFIGGGTPSAISPKFYQPFFDLIKPYLQKDAEITTEANPNSATKQWLEGMKALGVNRVSFGVQSFDDDKLTMLGRNHTSHMATQAIENAHKVGFKNISLDLIYGTSVDTKKLLENDIKIAFSLPINHLSAYSLTLEEGTDFFNKPQVQNDDENLAYWFTEKIPLPQYEISNFGSFKSKHNLGYWQYKDYLGIGSGAVGFLKDKRFYTQNDIESYINNPLDIKVENLDKEAIISEKILLGIRSMVGFSKSLLTKHQLKNAMVLVGENKLVLKNTYFFNSNYFLSDEIALYILEH